VFDEELETISFRIPKSRVEEIDRSARERGESRSQFLRRTIDQALPA
jgi:metal-responsive CopG/Arc/MetJ family transcriptional regulator